MQSRTHVTLSFQMSQHADVGRWRHDHHANTRPAPLEMHCRACFRGPRPLCTKRRAVCAEPTRAIGRQPTCSDVGSGVRAGAPAAAAAATPGTPPALFFQLFGVTGRIRRELVSKPAPRTACGRNVELEDAHCHACTAGAILSV